MNYDPVLVNHLRGVGDVLNKCGIKNLN